MAAFYFLSKLLLEHTYPGLMLLLMGRSLSLDCGWVGSPSHAREREIRGFGLALSIGSFSAANSTENVRKGGKGEKRKGQRILGNIPTDLKARSPAKPRSRPGESVEEKRRRSGGQAQGGGCQGRETEETRRPERGEREIEREEE